MVYSVSPNPPPCKPLAPPRTTNLSQRGGGGDNSSLSSSTLVGSSQSSASSSSSSTSSSSETESDPEEDEGTTSSDDDEEETLKLERLLIKAKESAKQRRLEQEREKKQGIQVGGEGDGLAGNEEIVLFGGDDDDSDSDEDDDDNGTPKASTSKPLKLVSLPPSLVQPLSLAPSTNTVTTSALFKGKSRAGPITLSQDLSGILSSSTSSSNKSAVNNNGQGEKWGLAPVPRLSKKAYKANQPHTAGSKWFDMPATPMTPELKRELDAMRLRNSLDPKKFMKGGAKNEKIGEFFQVGHVITPNTRATTNTSLPTASKRSFVEELVEDEQARAYARKKTKEVMQKGMSGRKRQRNGGKGSYAMGMGGGKDGAGSAGGKRRKR